MLYKDPKAITEAGTDTGAKKGFKRMFGRAG